jgi:serine/threonine-protein kinase
MGDIPASARYPERPAMHRFRTSATTRTASRPPLTAPATLLENGQTVHSVESGLSYRVGRLLGAGGFGQVFFAVREGRSGTVPETVCVKVSTRLDGWLREAYFGQLLQDHPRAVRVYDTFPVIDGSRVLYCLAIEYACHGDLSAFLARHPAQFTEKAVRREIAGILHVLGKLHRGQLLHRDLTPLNVFVCDRHRLKLGDFGIVRQQSDRRGVTARTLNPLMAPSDIFDGAAPKWQARDDVYQVGQLIGMLVKGDATRRVRTSEVRRLACSDQLKEIVYRCIGERRKRYESADELIRALEQVPAPMRVGAAVKSLKGVHLAFTGIFSVPRIEAQGAARRAGAVVHSGLSAKTSVLVRGAPNPLQAAGRDGGRKLMEIKRLREKGVRITLLSEAQFWKLVGRRVRA